MRQILLLWSVVGMALCFAGNGLAAQSTKDVPVTGDMKRTIRAEILGGQDGTGAGDEYIIGHGDLLGVSVYGEGDMAASLAARQARPAEAGSPEAGPSAESDGRGIRVMMDGRISLLHIGDVEVVGLTLTQLADYLKRLYATIYEDPIVTTTLVQSNSMRYTIMGKVESPGVFHLDYPMTVMQTIARSDGFTEWANKKITVVREQVTPDDEAVFTDNKLDFDYDRFVSGRDLGKNILIRAGDIIIVH